ncbi:Uncharacterized protein dnl_32770 [Desulfonema limicola]|uniref:Uncharacterized protein n=1 Tax=Desulfonema limicola TaxID=45656 RepID=A0A975B9B1_9BACT|nr:hypothetical protein [Desulfonema limicola]QTA80960.1 Uncharacterized protein dnl_32770 [Desulfonema limicola]
MKMSIMLLLLAWAGFFVLRADAGEIGFIENFSLAHNRTEALKELIPGTWEYYFFHCLNAQHQGDFKEVHRLLDLWIKRQGYTDLVKEILNRQALLEYHQNPEKTLEYISRELGLKFDHQKEISSPEINAPESLDQNLINIHTLTQNAFSRYDNLQGFEDSGLDILEPGQLNPDRRRDLLQRLKYPDFPDLAKLVVDDLRYKHSRGFGSFNIHRQMLKSQLDECREIMPELLDNSSYINTYLTKLAPSQDTDIEFNLNEKKAYLEQMWTFVKNLAPGHNSLKVHILFHILDMNRKNGLYNPELFLTYIKLPRNAPYINPDYLNRKEFRHVQANLGADFAAATTMQPVSRDEELVKDYLSHFFIKEENFNTYVKFIQDKWLKKVFAETKILNGIGDMEQWYSMMDPNEYRLLKDRVDIDFAMTNKEFFSGDEPVKLELYIKNAETLIVKAYELNTLNYYQTFNQEVDTAVNLDGLTATWEDIITFDTSPFLRKSRILNFPYLDKPGVFIIEFIGNGKSSRAVIRKGKLHFLSQITGAGHEFAVLDENNVKCPDASIYLTGREYKADEHGIITIPFSTRPGNQTIILKNKDFCTLESFEHLAESYRLSAGFYADRESLLRRGKAKVIVRPFLTLNSYPASLSILENIRFAIESRDMDGVSTILEIPDFKVFEDKESFFEFQVPENLAEVSFSLKAEVSNMSTNKTDQLEAAGFFSLNQIDTTLSVQDMFLSHTDTGYILEIFGKNGESVSGVPVYMEFKNRYFRDPVYVTLQTNKKGSIDLGKLDNIETIKAKLTQGISHTWNPVKDLCTYPASIHQQADKDFRIYTGSGTGKPGIDFTLLEKRGQTWFKDYSDNVKLKPGFLEISGLPGGDYDLFLKKSQAKITIRVSRGVSSDDFIISDYRILEINENHQLNISKIDPDKDFINIELDNASEYTRVHVIAAHFMPDFKVFQNLVQPQLPEASEIRLSTPRSRYLAGRRIGDEYRYILDRKYADKFPGNMLNRPELLLNPWSIRKTQTAIDTAKSGEAMYSAVDQVQTRGTALAEEARVYRKNISFSSLDFLEKPSVMLINLKPDKNGKIKIQRQDLGKHRQLHVIAVDPLNTVYRETSLSDPEISFKDLRMSRKLDPDINFTEQKKISLINPGQIFQLEDITTSDFEIYDSLDKVYSLLSVLGEDPVLQEFKFILNWPEMTDIEKQEKFSKYTCHELNFFIYHKDPRFFNSVILPFIENKKNKTFLDKWLTGQDIDQYNDPWEFSQLNIVEKILLLQAGSKDKNRAGKYVKDIFNMIPPDIDQFNLLFDTALKGRSLEQDDFEIKMDEIMFQAAPEQEMSRRSFDDDQLMAAPSPPQPASASNIMQKSIKSEMMSIMRDKGVQGRAQAAAKREKQRQFFQQMDKTEEWAENNYYKLPIINQDSHLITVNRFWNDFAANDPEKPFYSTNFQYASKNFSEIMMALSVLDLPFSAKTHESEVKDLSFSLKPASPMIVFHKEIRKAVLSEEKIPVMLSQNFFRTDDRYKYVDNERFDKFIIDEFLFRTAYGCQAVLSNPTSSRQKLRILLQVPQGSVPLQTGFYSKGIPVTIEPYNTKTFEYYFYFPKTGSFNIYPAQVAKNEAFITSAHALEFKVVKSPTKIDPDSWDYISQNGTDEDVLNFLNTHNVNRLDLNKIAFRMKNRNFFNQVTGFLKSLPVYNHTLWSYSIFHNMPERIVEFLNHSSFAEQCGMVIDSPLLTIDPVARKTFEHLEYKPLVNARAHQLGKGRKILNNRFFEQYQTFMKKLSYQAKPDNNDYLAVTYYMLLQDRVADAVKFFRQVDPLNINSKIQYDYVQVYLDFYTKNTESAKRTAAKYAQYPVPRWRSLFQLALSQLDEINQATSQKKNTGLIDKESREQRMEKLAETEPVLDFKVESRRIFISYRNLKSCQINYYPMDIEMLFSRNPFVQQKSTQFSYIKPSRFDKILLPNNQEQFTLDLPKIYHNNNLMVEITAKGIKKSQAYYSNSLDVQVIENYGYLNVKSQETKAALPETYVKVYARMKDGSVQFFKDGYTDLRGRFDYVSLSTDELDQVKNLAMLILSDKHGAVIKEAIVPKQ